MRPNAGWRTSGIRTGSWNGRSRGWWKRWELAKDDDDSVADEVGNWLRSAVPPSGPPTLLHNDWRLDNMAVSPADPGVCVAVYDWDMATQR